MHGDQSNRLRLIVTRTDSSTRPAPSMDGACHQAGVPEGAHAGFRAGEEEAHWAEEGISDGLQSKDDGKKTIRPAHPEAPPRKDSRNLRKAPSWLDRDQ